MDNKKIIIIISILAAILYGVYFVGKRNEDEQNESGDASDSKPVVINTIPVNNGGSFVDTTGIDNSPEPPVGNPSGGTTTQSPAVDPYSGAGKTAIANQIRGILSDSSLSLQIASDARIYDDVFRKVRTDLRSLIQSDLFDASGITSLYQLYPDRNSNEVYEDGLRNFKAKGDVVKSKIGSKGFGNVSGSITQAWTDSSDLKDYTGLKIMGNPNESVKPILSALNQLERWGDRDDANELVKQFQNLADGFLEAQAKFDTAVENLAISRLKAAGWNFIGL